MSSARETILASVRARLGRTGGAQPPERPALARTGWARSDVEGFIARVQAAGAGLQRIAALHDLPHAVATYLRNVDLDCALLIGDDIAAWGLDWTPLSVCREPLRCGFPASLTTARFGIAETGTLLLTSSAASPTCLNFLADHHLVVLKEADLRATLEDALAELRRNGEELPRTINLITGPSRTADIEQTIQLGAHGPRHLQVFLID